MKALGVSGPLVLAVALVSGCDGDLSTATPAPSADVGVRMLVAGDAQLAGNGWQACSTGGGAAASADRWCAFFRSSSQDPGRTELWVIDATKVMNGQEVPCDGSSPLCLLLTDRLSTEFKIESPSHPEAHHFEGDTLFFLAETNASAKDLERYEGYVWAWRPGWRKARPLTTSRGVTCRGTENAAVALCVDGVTDVPLEFDLRAGALVDADNSLLPLVERMAPIRDNQLIWSASFSVDGRTLAFSSWRTGEAEEVLRTIPVKDIGRARPTDIVRDGRDWRLGPDGRSVFFHRGGSRQTRTGELWTADFPSGGNARMLAAGVRAFEFLGGGGLGFITDMQGLEGTLHLLPDWRHPEQGAFLVPDTHAWYPVDEGRFLFILQVDEAGQRGLIADVGRGAVCGLGSHAGAPAFSASFVPHLGLLTWTEPDPSNEDVEITFLGRPEGCAGARPAGSRIDYLQSDGAHGLVFGANDGMNTLTLSYLRELGEGPFPTITEPLLTQVPPDNVGPLGSRPDGIVATSRPAGMMSRGIFVFGPFSGRPAQ